MKYAFIFLIIAFIPGISIAQKSNSPTDSIAAIEKKLSKMRKDAMEQLNQNEEYKTLSAQLLQMRRNSDNYGAFVIFGSLIGSDFEKFNKEIATAGFSPIKDNIVNIGIGFSYKKNRRMFDFNVSGFGIGKKSKKGEEYIKTSFATMFQLEWGYDFIKSNRINIYPFAGLGLRNSTLEYKPKVTTNPAYTSVLDIIQNNKSFNVFTTTIGYQAGMGAEFVLSPNNRNNGSILFLKAGTNRPFKEKAFEIEGVKYNPEFKYGNMVYTLGVKFFGR